MARAFRPRVNWKTREKLDRLEESLGFPLGKPRVGRGALHDWLPVKSGPVTEKSVKRCVLCGCLSTNPTRICGDPVPGHLYVYHGCQPDLWVGEERTWRRAAKGKRK
jgi:hypothetical protein